MRLFGGCSSTFTTTASTSNSLKAPFLPLLLSEQDIKYLCSLSAFAFSSRSSSSNSTNKKAAAAHYTFWCCSWCWQSHLLGLSFSFFLSVFGGNRRCCCGQNECVCVCWLCLNSGTLLKHSTWLQWTPANSAPKKKKIANLNTHRGHQQKQRKSTVCPLIELACALSHSRPPRATSATAAALHPKRRHFWWFSPFGLSGRGVNERERERAR